MAIYRYKALLQAKAAFEAGLWVRGCAILTALNSVSFAYCTVIASSSK